MFAGVSMWVRSTAVFLQSQTFHFCTVRDDQIALTEMLKMLTLNTARLHGNSKTQLLNKKLEFS